MPVTYVDTMPRVVPLTWEVPYSLFTAVNQSVQITSAPNIPAGTRVIGVLVHKEVAFDTNTVAFGTGLVTAQQGNISDATETAAGTRGVVEPSAWKAPGALADILIGGAAAIYARLGAGSLPTAGMIRITLLTWRVSPRSVL